MPDLKPVIYGGLQPVVAWLLVWVMYKSTTCTDF